MTTPGDEHTDLRERLARALYQNDRIIDADGHAWDEFNLSPRIRNEYRTWADALLPVVTAHTDAALTEQQEQMVGGYSPQAAASILGWFITHDTPMSLGQRSIIEALIAYLDPDADVVREVGGS